MFVSSGLFFKGMNYAFFFPKYFDLFITSYKLQIPKGKTINVIFPPWKKIIRHHFKKIFKGDKSANMQ